MATFKPVVFSTKNHIKSDGTTNIKIRVYHNKESQYIPTPFYIVPEHLGNDGNIVSDYRDCDLLNFELGELIQKYRKVTLKLGTTRISRMSCMEVREQIIAACEPDYEFIDFIKFARELISETVKDKTREWYTQSLNSFIWFMGRERIDARDITDKRIEEYKKALAKSSKSGKAMEPGGISNYLRGLRAMYNRCKHKYNDVNHDIIRINNEPFPENIIPAYKRKRKSISVEDLKRIRDFDCITTRTRIARDTFMIMFYLMGININDLYKLQTTKYGRIVYERSKTNTEDNIYNYALSIRIEPELQILLDKYTDGHFLSYFKLRYANTKSFMRAVNEGLETLCEELKLPKITTNWARHTWASTGRNKAGVAKADIDFCLGHVNNDTKMADIYIDIDYGIFDKCNRAILDQLKEQPVKKNKKKLEKSLVV